MSDEEYVGKKRPDRIYFSKEISVDTRDGKRSGRYVSRVVEEADREHFATVNGEVLLRTTPSGRQQIKAFFLVDDRGMRSLTLQRFSVGKEHPLEQAHFSLRGDEIRRLLDLALLIRTAQFGDEGKMRLEEKDLDQFVLSKEAARSLLKANPRLLAELARRDITEQDVVAIAYRREQLARFDRLLKDPGYFETERDRLKCSGKEPVWQRFFESNPWIFGYGLSYLFTTGFDEDRLEQVVAGASIGVTGKRVDALLRTRGYVSSLCFVEIKTHLTPLLQKGQYRPDVWSPSNELSGAVAQIQKTVDSAERALERRLRARGEDGIPTGTVAFLVRPRSVVVVGSLREFIAPVGVDEARFTSFELYRRQLLAPEIMTFDELYERARFIVASAGE